MSASEGARGLYQRWQRESDIPLRERMVKVRSVVFDSARARAYLRRAEVGALPRVTGRPRITIEGTMIVGDLVRLRSIVAPVELHVGPGATLRLGDNVHLNSGVTIAALSYVELGNRIEVGPHVTIYDNSFHDLYDRTALPPSKPVVIEDDVWLAAKCTILPGVRIGRGAVVAANALVTKDVEPFTVVSGVPAQLLSRLDPEKLVNRYPTGGNSLGS